MPDDDKLIYTVQYCTGVCVLKFLFKSQIRCTLVYKQLEYLTHFHFTSWRILTSVDWRQNTDYCVEKSSYKSSMLKLAFKCRWWCMYECMQVWSVQALSSFYRFSIPLKMDCEDIKNRLGQESACFTKTTWIVILSSSFYLYILRWILYNQVVPSVFPWTMRPLFFPSLGQCDKFFLNKFTKGLMVIIIK